MKGGRRMSGPLLYCYATDRTFELHHFLQRQHKKAQRATSLDIIKHEYFLIKTTSQQVAQYLVDFEHDSMEDIPIGR